MMRQREEGSRQLRLKGVIILSWVGAGMRVGMKRETTNMLRPVAGKE